MTRFTRNDYEPDICFWVSEKAQHFTARQSAFPPPDFIVEILSDSTEERDRGVKMNDYASHEVREYWIVDTENQSVEQYLLRENAYILHLKLKEGRLVSEAVKGFEIEVTQIFE
ncbi:MAG: Uma2 family endonuclease [Bacteroidia bacterium]|nr:Uma2 family endonuclease [Bacteroidia bacterium]